MPPGHCKQIGSDSGEMLHTGWKRLQWDIANRLEETVVRHCIQVGRDCSETLQTGWKRLLWDVANRLEMTAVRHCKQVRRDQGETLQTGCKWRWWDIANRLEETAVRHCKQVAGDSGETLQTGCKWLWWLSCRYPRWNCKQGWSQISDLVCRCLSGLPEVVDKRRAVLNLFTSSHFYLKSSGESACTHSNWTASLQWFSTWSFQFSLVFHLEFPVFSGFPLGVPSLQWFSSWGCICLGFFLETRRVVPEQGFQLVDHQNTRLALQCSFNK